MPAAAFARPSYGGPISGVYSLAVLIPSLAVGSRRLHDIGRSGWWQLIGLVPLEGLPGVHGIGQQDDVAGARRGCGQRRVRLFAGDRLAEKRVRRLAFRFPESDVDDDRLGLAAIEVIEQDAVQRPRPRPAPDERRQRLDRRLVDLDQDDVGVGIGSRPPHPLVVEPELHAVERAEGRKGDDKNR